MTQLYISLPGEKKYKIFQEQEGGSHRFSFVSFDGLRLVEIPMAETGVENLEAHKMADSAIPESPDQKIYEKLIARTIREIRKENLGKVVISRSREIPGKPDPLGLFRKLVQAYPQACVYLFSHPAAGTWIGATPETLLRKEGKRLSTMSLAGTRRKGEEHSFSAKEEKEQELVTDYIYKLFKNEKGLRNQEVSEPEMSEAGNLVHFKTEISAELTRDFLPASLMEKLHPTPAVGGYPLKESLDFIDRYENYDRSFYSGYFGLNDGQDFHYFVNLRCMQVFENSVVLYAGGGITRDSDPTAEWEETEAKMRTLLDVLEQTMPS